MPRCTWLPQSPQSPPRGAMRFSIQPTPMRVDLRPDLRPFAVSSQADGGLPRRPRRCAAGLGAASAFLGVFGGENEEGARNTYVAGILLAEANGSNQILRYYVYGQGLLAMVTPSGASYSYHYDATGNTVAMTDGSQAVVNRYAYTPYGRIVGKAESVPQPFQYVGQSGVMAEPNGFYYMRARYYDPEVGRFVSEDPIGFEGGDVNLYAYVGGNPILLFDPSGLAVGDWWDLPANVGRAREIADEEINKRRRQHNDIGDAMRHAEWNRRMVEETNTFTAWIAGVGHEVDNLIKDDSPWRESMMDLHNNAEGRAAGQQGRQVDINNLQTTPGSMTPYNSFYGGLDKP